MGFVTFGNFKTQLGIVYSNHASSALEKDLWVVKKEFHYHIDGDVNKIIIVPRGFLTDGATVPRVFWNIVPPWGRYGQAVVLHDYLCEYQGFWNYGVWESLTRAQIDKIFDIAMGELGVNSFTRKLMYRSVRAYDILGRFNKNATYKNKRTLEKEILSVYDRTELWI